MDSIKPSTIKAVFFDLDATLLALPDEAWEKEYPKLLVPHFTDLFEPEVFFNYFWKATDALLKHNDPNKTVLESFFIPFSEMSGLSRKEVWDRFIKFYNTDFAKLRNSVVADGDDGVKLVNFLKSNQMPMILASNPIFPEIATIQRVKWAGLNWDDFKYITHGENSYTSKPDEKYYRNLAKMVSIDPENILMVGNSYYYDGFASKYGFKTYIYDKFSSQEEFKDQTVIHGEGSLGNLLQWFQS